MPEVVRGAEHIARYKHFSKLGSRWTVVPLLFCGGAVLVTLGLAGVLGLLGSLSRASVFNPPQWVNWLHLSFGTFVLTVASIGNRKLQLSLAMLAAVAGTILGLVDLLARPAAGPQNGMPALDDPSDPLTHLAVGLLAIWALHNCRRKRSTA
ncbi:MAG: hypothetical protein JO061_17040 [Acidobacteriaceae bacterium]|nr:hypothetical protein [Acidobacteriaceae bacterium]